LFSREREYADRPVVSTAAGRISCSRGRRRYRAETSQLVTRFQLALFWSSNFLSFRRRLSTARGIRRAAPVSSC